MALRDPREGEEVLAERVVRAGVEPEVRRFAAGAAGRQIGQFSRKRLWRQKLGGTRLSLGALSRYVP